MPLFESLKSLFWQLPLLSDAEKQGIFYYLKGKIKGEKTKSGQMQFYLKNVHRGDNTEELRKAGYDEEIEIKRIEQLYMHTDVVKL